MPTTGVSISSANPIASPADVHSLPPTKSTGNAPRRIGGENLATVLCFTWFIAIFFLGSAFTCSNRQNVSLQEKRELAPVPSLHHFKTDLPLFASRFEPFFQDRFFGRLELIAWRNLGLVKIFHTSSTEDVLLGKLDWMYYNKPTTGLPEALRHETLLSAQSLLLWKRMLQYRAETLRAKGIGYMVMVAPEKSTIYPDQLPSSVQHENKPNRIDQIQKTLEGTGIPLINVESDLLRQRQFSEVYFHTDSHWNDIGASIAARRILDCARRKLPAIPPMPEPKFTPIQRDGDLTDMMGLHGLMCETVPGRVTPPYADTHLIGAPATPGEDVRQLTWHFYTKQVASPQNKLPRALMLHDSFGLTLVDYLNPYFSEIQFHTTHDFNPNEIIAAKPDIVIDEMAERRLYECYPDNQPFPIKSQTTNETVLTDAQKSETGGTIGPAAFGDSFELLDGQSTKTSSGILLKLHWRSKVNQTLNYNLGFQCVGDADFPVLAGHEMPQDVYARAVKAGDEWFDVIEVPHLDVKSAKRIGLMMFTPGTAPLRITAGKADSTGLRLPIKIPN